MLSDGTTQLATAPLLVNPILSEKFKERKASKALSHKAEVRTSKRNKKKLSRLHPSQIKAKSDHSQTSKNFQFIHNFFSIRIYLFHLYQG
jgi:hypothetical protein